MKKVILGLALVVILALAVGVYYVLTNLDAIVKAAIEKHGSAVTQTAVRVDKVHIGLREGAGTINGLTVANPRGFTQPQVFSLGEIGVGIDIKSLKEQPYVINKITVRALQVFMEMNQDKQTNLNELKKTISPGKAAAQPAQKTEQPAGEQPRLIIRKLVFADGTIHAKVVPLNNKEYTLKLPSLNMTNLGGTPGKSRGATPAELAKEIMNRLIDEAKQAIKQKGIDAELDKLKARGKAIVDEEKAKLKEKTDSKLETEKQKVQDKLKGLFKK